MANPLVRELSVQIDSTGARNLVAEFDDGRFSAISIPPAACAVSFAETLNRFAHQIRRDLGALEKQGAG